MRSNERQREGKRDERERDVCYYNDGPLRVTAANVKSSISRHLRSRFLLERSAIDSPDPPPRPATSRCYSIALYPLPFLFVPSNILSFSLSRISSLEMRKEWDADPKKKKKRKRFIIDSSIEREIPQNELILKIERDIVSSTIGLVSVCYPSLRLIVRIRWNTTTNQRRDKSNKLSNLSINYLYKIKW